LAHAKSVRETYEYTVATVLKPEAEAILQNAQNFVKTVKKYLEKLASWLVRCARHIQWFIWRTPAKTFATRSVTL